MIAGFINGCKNFHFTNIDNIAIVIGVVAGAVDVAILHRGILSSLRIPLTHSLPSSPFNFILGIDFFIGAIIFGLMASIIITLHIKGNSIIKVTPPLVLPFSSFLAFRVSS